MLILSVMQIFWLSALAQSIGIQVTLGQGVDCFSLIPPNLTGYLLMGIGFVVSLTIYYLMACFFVGLRSCKHD